MNTRTTLTVVILALLVVGYFLIFETDLLGLRRTTTREQERQLVENPPAGGAALFTVAELPPAGVQTLRIEQPDQPAVVIERDAPQSEDFHQVEPVHFAMANWTMESLINDAAGLRYISIIDPQQQNLTLASLGLEPPRATLTLTGETTGNDPQPFTHTIRLGRTVAAGRAYVQIDDRPQVFVVDEALHRRLVDRPPHEMRSKSLPSIAVGRINQLIVDSPAGHVELLQEDGDWSITAPATGRADRDAAQQLGRTLNRAYIERFIKDNPTDPAAFGLADPAATLTMIVEEEPAVVQPTEANDDAVPSPATTEHRLALGNPTDLSRENYFAMWDDLPVVFSLGKDTWDSLNTDAIELRAKQLTDAQASDIRDVLIERADGPVLHVRREAGIWQFAEPVPDYEIDPVVVGELVDALVDAESVDGLILDSPGFDEARTTLTIAAAGMAQNQVIYIRQSDDQLHTVHAGHTLANVFEPAALQPLFEPPLYYRNRTVLDLPADSIQRIQLVRSGEFPANYQFERSEPTAEDAPGDWQLEGFDADRFRQMLDHLTPLRATGWVGEQRMYIPEGVTLHIHDDQGNKHMLTVHVDADEAELSGIDRPFKLDPAFVDLLTGELRDRVALSVDADQIASVSAEGWTIERDTAGVYQLVGRQDIDEAAAGAMFDTLAGLRVSHWLGDRIPPSDTPDVQRQITMRDGRTRKLQLWRAEAQGRNPVARIDDGELFTISSQAMEKLAAEPILPPEK
jgi:hypothetical protein